jgi:hypothetical protein
MPWDRGRLSHLTPIIAKLNNRTSVLPPKSNPQI